MADKFCSFCGARNVESSKFCDSCGAKFEDCGTPAQSQPFVDPYFQTAPAEEGKKKSAKGLGIFIIILSVIGIGFAFLYLYMALNLEAVINSVDWSQYATPEMTVDQLKNAFRMVVWPMAIASVLTVVCGFIAARCCLKGEHFAIGLAMVVIAMITSAATTLLGLIVGLIVVVWYATSKQSFND